MPPRLVVSFGWLAVAVTMDFIIEPLNTPSSIKLYSHQSDFTKRKFARNLIRGVMLKEKRNHERATEAQCREFGTLELNCRVCFH